MAAYLIYDEANNGQVKLVWSKDEVSDSIVVATPNKTVPEHKFKTNGGRYVMQTVNNTPANYYSGVARFFKETNRFDCQYKFQNEGRMHLSFVVRYKDDSIRKYDVGASFDLVDVAQFGATVSSSQEFDVHMLTSAMFTSKLTGKNNGAYVSLE